jgi:hypothetical protein
MKVLLIYFGISDFFFNNFEFPESCRVYQLCLYNVQILSCRHIIETGQRRKVILLVMLPFSEYV